MFFCDLIHGARTLHPVTSRLRAARAQVLASGLILLLAFAWTVVAADLQWQPIAGGRAARLDVPTGGKAGFTLVRPEQSGVTFTNSLDEWASAGNRVLNSGSGVAAGDFDNDGLVDLFFCSLNQRNRLFKNLGGWKFKDVTDEAGLRFPALYYRAAVFADLNGDGWLDLLVGTVSRGVLCFLNDQRGHFTNATEPADLTSPFANETLALADIDGNGTLDLYVCNNRNDDIRDWPRVPVNYVNKKPTVPPQLRERITFENGVIQEFGEPSILYLNDGRAHFRSVLWTNGAFFDEREDVLASIPLDWGLAAAFRDLNGDGAPDLYVCNDYWTPDRIWINGGRGRFKAIDSLAVRKVPASSMGVDFADVNRDGHLDIFAVDMLSRSSELRRRQTVAKRPTAPRIGDIETRVQTPRNTLLLNRGDGTFAEIACFAGVQASEWSWSPLFLDVDLDGYEDLLITAGHLRDIQDFDANDRIRAQQEAWRQSPLAATNLPRAFLEARREHAKFYPPLDMPVVAFHNGGALHFEEATAAWGLNVPGVNHGIAFADLDNDGDLDLVVNRLGSPAAVFRNDAPAPRIAVRLRGRTPNTQAIGAKIELLGGAVSNQISEVTSGGHYMSGCDTLRAFATVPAEKAEGRRQKAEGDQGVLTTVATNEVLKLRITWRDGSITELADIRANHLYEIDEAAASRITHHAPRTTNAPPLFQDVSSLLNHVHHDVPFDDFARQPTLPRKLSQSGPGAAWFDLDGDGWDDLIIGSGKGGQMAVFRNQSGKGFVRETNALFAGTVARDQTTVIGWQRAGGKRAILAGSASYEDGATNLPCVQSFDLAAGKIGAAVPGHTASIGPLALADIDGDGDLDLFVGGQVVPGHYPLPARSLLFRFTDGVFQRDQENSRVLANIGLVNGAVWSDLDGDGFPELILACEWGPLRIFHNAHGKLEAQDPAIDSPLSRTTNHVSRFMLHDFTGLWQSVTSGDFDGDGLLDIVAGNWGMNSCWRASLEQPLTIFFGDLGGRGATDILEAEFDERGQLVPRHLRDTLAPALPWLAAQFPTHAAWSRASVADVIQGRESQALSLTAATLATTVFLNRKDHFEARPLPVEAQFAPAFGLCVSDFDGDGRADIFLAQNFFAFRVEDSRLDAGRGLLLRGDGRGGFDSAPAETSGIKVDGEQRGAAVCDFNEDGRMDLVVTQNGASTRLFQNTSGAPGLRVRLLGPPGNPLGIGAVVRLYSEKGAGPAHEVHSGSGYWSQDSAALVLALAEPPRRISVRWPGGKTTETALPTGAGAITMDYDGIAKPVQ